MMTTIKCMSTSSMIKQNLQLFEDHKLTSKNKFVHLACDFETKDNIKVKSFTKGDTLTRQLFYNFIVHCVNGDGEEEEDSNTHEIKAEELVDKDEEQESCCFDVMQKRLESKNLN